MNSFPEGPGSENAQYRDTTQRSTGSAEQADDQLAPAPQRASGAVRRGALLGSQIVAGALSLSVLIGSGVAWSTYRNFTADIRHVTITSHSKAAAKNIDGSAQNILIVGNDDRDSATDAELAQLGTTRDGGSYNTDTMMLLHVPADGTKATVLSFPRDSYVPIPGHGKNKLNSAYVDGVVDSHGSKAAGASLLTETLENLTGLNIDHFVQVDLLGFYRISNAIGGVPVCLNNAMRPATYDGQEGNGFDSGYEPDGRFVRSYSGINLKKGENVIQGTQALAFVRQRHGLPAGDLDRIKRQQYFLSAVFRKLTSGGTLLNPFKLQHLLKAVTSSLTMDDLDPVQLAEQLQNLSAGNVTFTTIPLAGEDPDSPVGDVVLVNTAAMPGFITSLLGGQPAKASKAPKTADPKTVTVTVVNDSDSLGLESANAAALRKLGFQTTVPPATPDVVQKTTIRYPKSAETGARAVAKAVPDAELFQSDQVDAVTLVLGNDGVQVPAGSAGSSSSTGSTGSSGSAGSAGSTGSAVSSASPPVTTNAAQAGCIN